MNYIDLRSDTVTMPTDEMIEAMCSCQVGDDVYGDDPTINKLEELASHTMGKEASLFLPSGTMGNQLAIMTHTKRGDEIIIGKNSHINFHEVGAAAVLSNVSCCLIHNDKDFVLGTDIKNSIRRKDIHNPDTGLVCLENPLGNGLVVSLENMKCAYETAKQNCIPVHLDGARIFNAAQMLKVEAREIAQYSDSAMFCISKGLCSPVGSLLCGSHSFIKKARKYRKMLGGGMRQAGYLGACGVISIEKMSKRLGEDHENAQYLGKLLSQISCIKVDLDSIQINMVFFEITKEVFDEDKFIEKLLNKGIKINKTMGGKFRFVTHNSINQNDIVTVSEVIKANL